MEDFEAKKEKYLEKLYSDRGTDAYINLRMMSKKESRMITIIGDHKMIKN